jgi:predicted metal-dependent peptidase
MDKQQIETKLAAARTKLILDKPFLGALVMRLPMQEANPDWCPATATDAKKFYYNPEFIDQLNLDETQFMLAHEALHCALSHFARRQHRNKLHWDMACDYAINPLLIEDDLKPPPGSLFLPQFKDMTAEEIYPLLDEKDDETPLDNHVYDQDNTKGSGAGKTEKDIANKNDQNESDNEGDESENQQSGEGSVASQPPPLTPDEAETLNIQWQQRLAGAAQQAMQVGKLDGAMARMVDHLLQPQLPWRLLLARYMTAIARDDFSYMRPSRREGEPILPSLRSNRLNWWSHWIAVVQYRTMRWESFFLKSML